MINISIKKPKPVLVMVHNASKGLRGVGLSGVTLDKNGNLIFTMSDGTVKTIKGYSQNLINTTNAVNKIKEEVSTMANNAADSAKKAKETADSIKQEYDRVEGATNSGLALIERSVLYGINRVKEATKTCKSDALANIELAHKDAIDDIAIRRLEALQDISETLGGQLAYFDKVSVDNDTLTFRRGSGDTHRLTIDYVQHAHNASSATKLETARTINIQDATSAHTGTGASFNGTANATIKLPNTIDANITGAIIDKSGLRGYTKLYNSLSPNYVRAVVSNHYNEDNMSPHIWGACISFKYSDFQSGKNNSDNGGQLILGNGLQGLWYRSRNAQRLSDTDPEWHDLQQIAYTTSNVASATKLETARTINVQDASASNTGTGASFDGSGNATIKLPAKIKATLTGNADTATKATNDGNGNPIASTYLPLSGGTVTGSIQYVNNGKVFAIGSTGAGDNVNLGWNYNSKDGAGIGLRSTDYASPGEFSLYARDANNTCSLTGKPDGSLTWNNKEIATTEFVNAKAGNYLPLSGGTMTGDINMAKHNIIGGTSTNTGIYCAGNDNGGTLGTTGANINIKSWYGVGFINGLRDSDTYNKVTVGIDVREGIVHAKSFDGNAASATKATNDGNGNNIARTYLPLSGGTMTGKLRSNVGTVPIELLTTGTDHRDIQTFSTDGNHRIGVIRMEKDSSNNCTVTIGASNTSDEAPRGIIITRGTSGDSVIIGITPPAGDNSKKLATTEFVNAKAGNYLPLSGGTVTGSIQYVNNGKVFAIGHTGAGDNVNLGWNWNNRAGAGIGLRSTDYASPGEFSLYARDSANSCSLVGKPDGTLTWNNQPLLPVGIVQAFAGKTAPQGWLLCDGSAVSRTNYAALYAVIGTTYGAGNGSTTFNLPNLVDKFVEGSATAGTVKSAGLPNITGGISPFEIIGGGQDAPVRSQSGALTNRNHADNRSTASQSGTNNNGGSGFDIGIAFNASLSNPIYGKSTTVQPPALTMRYIIKY